MDSSPTHHMRLRLFGTPRAAGRCGRTLHAAERLCRTQLQATGRGLLVIWQSTGCYVLGLRTISSVGIDDRRFFLTSASSKKIHETEQGIIKHWTIWIWTQGSRTSGWPCPGVAMTVAGVPRCCELGSRWCRAGYTRSSSCTIAGGWGYVWQQVTWCGFRKPVNTDAVPILLDFLGDFSVEAELVI